MGNLNLKSFDLLETYEDIGFHGEGYYLRSFYLDDKQLKIIDDFIKNHEFIALPNDNVKRAFDISYKYNDKLFQKFKKI